MIRFGYRGTRSTYQIGMEAHRQGTCLLKAASMAHRKMDDVPRWLAYYDSNNSCNFFKARVSMTRTEASDFRSSSVISLEGMFSV